ncbi:hypothetical protein PFISCL1PPCAC_1052, partial [Pristionchus fissidentatus]
DLVASFFEGRTSRKLMIGTETAEWADIVNFVKRINPVEVELLTKTSPIPKNCICELADVVDKIMVQYDGPKANKSSGIASLIVSALSMRCWVLNLGHNVSLSEEDVADLVQVPMWINFYH